MNIDVSAKTPADAMSPQARNHSGQNSFIKTVVTQTYHRIVWLLLCNALSCAGQSYFDEITSGYHLTAQVTAKPNAAGTNAIAPLNYMPHFRRIELIAENDSKIVVFDRKTKELFLEDFSPIALSPQKETLLHRGKLNAGSLSIKHAKIYLNAIAFNLRATNFNQSQLIDAEEIFFVSYDTIFINLIQLFRGNTAALDRKAGSVRYFDTVLNSQTPLTLSPTSRYQLNHLSDSEGQDDQGSFSIVPVKGIVPVETKALRIRVSFDATDKFIWNDVLSASGSFDAASQDIFNWRLLFPITAIEIEEI